VSVDWRIIGVMTLLTGLLVLGIVYAALQNRHASTLEIGNGKVEAELVPAGTQATVRRTLAPDGTIYTMGEEWTAQTGDGATVERGGSVRVIGHDGMKLIVEPMLPSPSPAHGSATIERTA
jgi:membrane protein implicated in regulation of membrane protease activity